MAGFYFLCVCVSVRVCVCVCLCLSHTHTVLRIRMGMGGGCFHHRIVFGSNATTAPCGRVALALWFLGRQRCSWLAREPLLSPRFSPLRLLGELVKSLSFALFLGCACVCVCGMERVHFNLQTSEFETVKQIAGNQAPACTRVSPFTHTDTHRHTQTQTNTDKHRHTRTHVAHKVWKSSLIPTMHGRVGCTGSHKHFVFFFLSLLASFSPPFPTPPSRFFYLALRDCIAGACGREDPPPIHLPPSLVTV